MPGMILPVNLALLFSYEPLELLPKLVSGHLGISFQSDQINE